VPIDHTELMSFFVDALPLAYRKPVVKAIYKQEKKQVQRNAARKERANKPKPKRSLSRGGAAVRRKPMED
jgi:predicted GTPase